MTYEELEKLSKGDVIMLYLSLKIDHEELIQTMKDYVNDLEEFNKGTK